MIDKIIVAIDFDGTLCEPRFPEIGPPNTSLIGFLKNAKADNPGRLIYILWTCRVNTATDDYLTQALNWCKLQGLEIDYANESPIDRDFYPNGQVPRKMYADVYIDDLVYNWAYYDKYVLNPPEVYDKLVQLRRKVDGLIKSRIENL